ncbi:uncharacterized protein BDV17DRAFT_51005 [Aspergillus undulatus]|uniref:uncharacterized protein n=1 Tax=Aspergillus undulatus TaxID=1810928 RepID=UPI003CCCCE52
MTSTRPVGSRGKRKTTALDILNNLSNKKANTTDDRLTQSARPARQLKNMPRAPRRDIWDIPNSPEPEQVPVTNSSPLAAATARSPNRSTHPSLLNEAQNSAVRSSPRKPRAPIRYQEEYNDEGDSWQPSEEGSEDESMEEPEEAGDVEDQGTELVGNFNFFSDEERDTSPSAFQLEQTLEQSGRFESAQSTPHKPGSYQQAPNTRARNKSGQFVSTQFKAHESASPQRVSATRARNKSGQIASNKSAPNESETPQRAPTTRARSTQATQNASRSHDLNTRGEVQSPAVVISNSPNKVPETPLSERRKAQAQPSSSPAGDEDGDVEMDDDEYVQINGDEDNSGSESTSSDGSSSLFARQDSPEPSARRLRQSTRTKKPQQSADARVLRPRGLVGKTGVREPSVPQESPEAPQSDRRWSLSQDAPARSQSSADQIHKSPSEQPVSGAYRQPSSRALANRRIRGRNSRIICNIPAQEESPEQESSYPQEKDALKIGGQQHNWKILIDEARKINKLARSRAEDSSMEEDSNEMAEMIGHLQRQYENFYRGLGRSLDASAKDARECANSLDRIKYVGHQILDDVYKLVAERGDEEQGRELFEGLEARVVPALIQLVFTVFDRYHSSTGRVPSSYNHLCRTLALLSEICDRMVSLVKERYVRTTTRCTNLRPPLQKLIQASRDGSLKHLTPAATDQMEVIESDEEDPWTNVESIALLDGLKRHFGPGRYHLIMKDFHDQLGRRTIGELKEQARWMCDKFVTRIQDEIGPPQGRENWHWLLSVRES